MSRGCRIFHLFFSCTKNEGCDKWHYPANYASSFGKLRMGYAAFGFGLSFVDRIQRVGFSLSFSMFLLSPSIPTIYTQARVFIPSTSRITLQRLPGTFYVKGAALTRLFSAGEFHFPHPSCCRLLFRNRLPAPRPRCYCNECSGYGR